MLGDIDKLLPKYDFIDEIDKIYQKDSFRPFLIDKKNLPSEYKFVIYIPIYYLTNPVSFTKENDTIEISKGIELHFEIKCKEMLIISNFTKNDLYVFSIIRCVKNFMRFADNFKNCILYCIPEKDDQLQTIKYYFLLYEILGINSKTKYYVKKHILNYIPKPIVFLKIDNEFLYPKI